MFYSQLVFDEDIEPQLKFITSREGNTIISSPINKFPINLKKSENTSLNSDRINYFNKSTKKPSVKKELLLSNKDSMKKKLEIKTSLLKEIKNVKKEDKKEDDKKDDKNKNKKILKLFDNDNSLNESKKEENESDNKSDSDNSKKNDGKNKDKDKEKNKENKCEKELDNNLSQKSINNISAISKNTNKTIDSNKNCLNEENEDLNSINDNLHLSNKSLKNNKQIVPFDLNLINRKNSEKEIKLYEKIKIPKINQLLNKKSYFKANMNSTIKENENENFSNSSYYDNNKSKDNNIKTNINEKENMNIKNEPKVKKKNTILSKIVKDFTPMSKIYKQRKTVKINTQATQPKVFKLENNLIKPNERRISVLEPPIYHISSSNNDAEMARALSRKAVLKKKKIKTTNKYDFII